LLKNCNFAQKLQISSKIVNFVKNCKFRKKIVNFVKKCKCCQNVQLLKNLFQLIEGSVHSYIEWIWTEHAGGFFITDFFDFIEICQGISPTVAGLAPQNLPLTDGCTPMSPDNFHWLASWGGTTKTRV